MRVDAAHFVKSCDECQKANPSEQSPHGKHPVSGLFHTLSIHFAGPFSETDSSSRYVLLAVEHLCNWPVASVINPDMFNSIGVIKFVREQICVQYGNPVCVVSDGDSNFDNRAVRGFAKESSITWNIISAYIPRGNAKVERMVGTLKRAITKMVTANPEHEWSRYLNDTLVGYRRHPGTDGKTPLEVLFGIKPRFSIEIPQADYVASDSNLIRDLKVALAVSLRTSRIVPNTKAAWPRTFEIGDLVLVRRGRRVPGSRITSASWYGPFIVKESEHPRYLLTTEDHRKFRRPIHIRRLRQYVQRDYGPDVGYCCWFREFKGKSFLHKTE